MPSTFYWWPLTVNMCVCMCVCARTNLFIYMLIYLYSILYSLFYESLALQSSVDSKKNNTENLPWRAFDSYCWFENVVSMDLQYPSTVYHQFQIMK